MRKLIQTSAVLLALTLSVSAGRAQAPQNQGQDQSQGQGPHHDFHRRGPNPEFETKMLTKHLDLSESQASTILGILTTQEQDLKALRPAQGTTPDFKALREQRKTIMETANQNIEAQLNSEQLTKFQEMHKHHGPGGPGGPHGNWKGQGQSGATPAAPSL